MINPEHNDLRALAMGAIAPCVSAPWWEEVRVLLSSPRFAAQAHRPSTPGFVPRVHVARARTLYAAMARDAGLGRSVLGTPHATRLVCATRRPRLRLGGTSARALSLHLRHLIETCPGYQVIYMQSRNLVVTILIHAMWNSRVFLGSLLGL